MWPPAPPLAEIVTVPALPEHGGGVVREPLTVTAENKNISKKKTNIKETKKKIKKRERSRKERRKNSLESLTDMYDPAPRRDHPFTSFLFFFFSSSTFPLSLFLIFFYQT